MTWVWEQGVETDVLTTNILNDPLGDSVLLILEIQSSTRGPGHQREQILPMRPNNSHTALQGMALTWILWANCVHG